MTGVRSACAQHRYIVSSGVFHLCLVEFADVEPARMQGMYVKDLDVAGRAGRASGSCVGCCSPSNSEDLQIPQSPLSTVPTRFLTLHREMLS